MKQVSAATILAIALQKKETGEIKITELYRLSELGERNGLIFMTSFKEIIEAVNINSTVFCLSEKIGESTIKRSPNSEEFYKSSNFLERFTSELSKEEKKKIEALF